MTLIEQFNEVVERMANALNDSNMNRARMCADSLRRVQSEVTSCAKDARVIKLVNVEIDPPEKAPETQNSQINRRRAVNHSTDK